MEIAGNPGSTIQSKGYCAKTDLAFTFASETLLFDVNTV